MKNLPESNRVASHPILWQYVYKPSIHKHYHCTFPIHESFLFELNLPLPNINLQRKWVHQIVSNRDLLRHLNCIVRIDPNSIEVNTVLANEAVRYLKGERWRMDDGNKWTKRKSERLDGCFNGWIVPLYYSLYWSKEWKSKNIEMFTYLIHINIIRI